MTKKNKEIIEIKRIWYEEGNLYIHVKVRSGLFYLELEDGRRLDFLADIVKTKTLPKDETIYYFKNLA